MRKILLVMLVVALAIGLIAGVIIASGAYLNNRDNKIKVVSSEQCEGKTVTKHQANIENDKVSPKNTVGKLCDTLTITNLDKQTRDIAFGKHDEHIEYDGVIEEPVESGKSLTFTLNKTGNYLFHDHDDESVSGTFTVTE